MAGRYYVIDNTTDQHLAQEVRKNYLDDMGGGDCSIMAHLVGTEDDLPKSCDGDAFVLRDWLVERGYQWSRDFYIRRRKDGEPP